MRWAFQQVQVIGDAPFGGYFLSSLLADDSPDALGVVCAWTKHPGEQLACNIWDSRAADLP